MDALDPNSDLALLQEALNFFKEPSDCPFCNQKAHLIHLIAGLDLGDHKHDPYLCINNWIALHAIIDNDTNKMTPQKLQEYTDKMVFKVIREVRIAQKGEFAE